MIDEGPSPEDIERFSRADDVGFCPSCGAEMSELADVCPRCFEYLEAGPSRRPPIEQQFERKWIIVIVILLVLALIGLVAL